MEGSPRDDGTPCVYMERCCGKMTGHLIREHACVMQDKVSMPLLTPTHLNNIDKSSQWTTSLANLNVASIKNEFTQGETLGITNWNYQVWLLNSQISLFETDFDPRMPSARCLSQTLQTCPSRVRAASPPTRTSHSLTC